jgi:hypothetical protein
LPLKVLKRNNIEADIAIGVFGSYQSNNEKKMSWVGALLLLLRRRDNISSSGGSIRMI